MRPFNPLHLISLQTRLEYDLDARGRLVVLQSLGAVPFANSITWG